MKAGVSFLARSDFLAPSRPRASGVEVEDLAVMLGQAFASGRVIGRVNDLVSQLARIPPQSISAFARAHAAQLSSSFVE